MHKILFIGSHLSHSLLPLVYELIDEQLRLHLEVIVSEMSEKEVVSLFQNGNLKDVKFCCVTFPYKILASSLVENKSSHVQKSNAANIVYYDENGQLIAENTDGRGFLNDIQGRLNLKLENEDLLILGDGGVSKGILAELLTLNPKKIVICSRKTVQKDEVCAHCSYDAIPEINFKLIVNATTASIYHQLPPFKPHDSHTDSFFFECAYLRDDKTAFEQHLQNHNIFNYSNGVGMLIEQAAVAIEDLFHEKVDTKKIYQRLTTMIESVTFQIQK